MLLRLLLLLLLLCLESCMHLMLTIHLCDGGRQITVHLTLNGSTVSDAVGAGLVWHPRPTGLRSSRCSRCRGSSYMTRDVSTLDVTNAINSTSVHAVGLMNLLVTEWESLPVLILGSDCRLRDLTLLGPGLVQSSLEKC